MIKGHTKKCRKSWETISGGYYCPIHDKFIDQEEDFMDDMRQIWANDGKTCLYCKHLKDLFDSSCIAFPSQIPCPFLTGLEIHTKPGKYRQKNRIVFEPRLSCPFCKSRNTIPLIFRYFSKKNIGRWLRGEIEFKGRKVSEASFNRFCKDCRGKFLVGKKVPILV